MTTRQELAKEFDNDILVLLEKFNSKGLPFDIGVSVLSLHLCGMTIGSIGDNQEARNLLNAVMKTTWTAAKKMLEDAKKNER